MVIKKCPFCSQDLIQGYVKTKGEIITWSPNKERKPLFAPRWHIGENEIKLGEYSFFEGGRVSAFKCDKCNKIIIDIHSEEDIY